MNTQLYCIKCYSSCFFFSFLEQNCSAFTIEILIIVIKNAFLFSFLFLFFLYVTITITNSPNIFLKKHLFTSCCIRFLKWNALSFHFYSKNSFSKNIHYNIHLIFKNGIHNIFCSQIYLLLVSNDMHAMPNRKTVGYECNEFGEVTVIFCETSCEYYSTNAIFSLLSTLIKLQVDKFVSGTNVVKKKQFFRSYEKDCFTFQHS